MPLTQRHLLWSALCLSLSLVWAHAQVPTPAMPPAASPAAPPAATLDQQIATLQKYVALQEDKVRAITADMVAIDQNVERQVTLMIDRLTQISDSPDSDAKVVNQKREIIEALKKSIDFYRKQREERKAQLLHPTYLNVSDEDLQRDMAKLDERVEQRVDQILQVTAALAQDEHYDQYDRYTTDAQGRSIRVDDPARQAKHSTQRSVNAKDAVAEGLQRDKDRLEAENARLEQQLTLTHDPDTVEFLKASIDWNRELITRREEQIWSVATPGTPGQQPVSRKAANELDNLFDETRLDIKADYQKLVTLKSRRDQERERLKLLTDKLARATAARDARPTAPPVP